MYRVLTSSFDKRGPPKSSVEPVPLDNEVVINFDKASKEWGQSTRPFKDGTWVRLVEAERRYNDYLALLDDYRKGKSVAADQKTEGKPVAADQKTENLEPITEEV